MLNHKPRSEFIETEIPNPTKLAAMPRCKQPLLPLAPDPNPNEPSVRANIVLFLSDSRPMTAVPISVKADRVDVMLP